MRAILLFVIVAATPYVLTQFTGQPVYLTGQALRLPLAVSTDTPGSAITVQRRGVGAAAESIAWSTEAGYLDDGTTPAQIIRTSFSSAQKGHQVINLLVSGGTPASVTTYLNALDIPSATAYREAVWNHEISAGISAATTIDSVSRSAWNNGALIAAGRIAPASGMTIQDKDFRIQQPQQIAWEGRALHGGRPNFHIEIRAASDHVIAATESAFSYYEFIDPHGGYRKGFAWDFPDTLAYGHYAYVGQVECDGIWVDFGGGIDYLAKPAIPDAVLADLVRQATFEQQIGYLREDTAKGFMGLPLQAWDTITGATEPRYIPAGQRYAIWMHWAAADGTIYSATLYPHYIPQTQGISGYVQWATPVESRAIEEGVTVSTVEN